MTSALRAAIQRPDDARRECAARPSRTSGSREVKGTDPFKSSLAALVAALGTQQTRMTERQSDGLTRDHTRSECRRGRSLVVLSSRRLVVLEPLAPSQSPLKSLREIIGGPPGCRERGHTTHGQHAARALRVRAGLAPSSEAS